MTEIINLPIRGWHEACPAHTRALAIGALERGDILLLGHLDFALQPVEQALLTPAVASQSKNISFDPASQRLRGCGAPASQQTRLCDLLSRFASHSKALLGQVLPRYASALQRGRASFRPVEIADRSTSWRKDDTRLHVDSFPSSPVQGKRILRVFSNVNPHGKSRVWRLGDSFEAAARRYVGPLAQPLWGSDRLIELLGITKSRRSAYDHFMLQLHDRMKADSGYQSQFAENLYPMAPGATWVVFTDQVPHAAMAGQYALEQTYYLPVDHMLEPDRAPLRILERMLHRQLA